MTAPSRRTIASNLDSQSSPRVRAARYSSGKNASRAPTSSTWWVSQALAVAEEKALHVAARFSLTEAKAAVAREDFGAAMAALARLRAPLDAFFEKVLVNAEDAAVRANRLKLLTAIRDATLTVADFSKVGG